jgi:hypothetical protein
VAGNHRATGTHYNLCKMYSAIRMTSAIKPRTTHWIWTVRDMLAA